MRPDTMTLPIALADGLVLVGLTVPAMRAAIVLIGHADASGASRLSLASCCGSGSP